MKTYAIHTIQRRPDAKKPELTHPAGSVFDCPKEEFVELRDEGAARKATPGEAHAAESKESKADVPDSGLTPPPDPMTPTKSSETTIPVVDQDDLDDDDEGNDGEPAELYTKHPGKGGWVAIHDAAGNVVKKVRGDEAADAWIIENGGEEAEEAPAD